MKLKSKLSTLLALTVMCGTLVSIGCDVTERDVADARDNVVEEQRETVEVQREGQENVREKQQELAEARHQANRPNYDQNHLNAEAENVADAKQELAEAKRSAAENTAEEQQETEEAEMDANHMAQKLEATEARDAFVADLEMKLENYDKKIEAKKDSADNLSGDPLNLLESEIEAMRVKRAALSDAISEVKNADVMNWRSEKAIAQLACDRIDEELK